VVNAAPTPDDGKRSMLGLLKRLKAHLDPVFKSDAALSAGRVGPVGGLAFAETIAREARAYFVFGKRHSPERRNEVMRRISERSGVPG